jgi:pneumococcal surface protein, putative
MIITLNLVERWRKVNGFLAGGDCNIALNGKYVKNIWVDATNGKTVTSTWIFDKNYNGWYYLRSDGSYARNQWVDGYYLTADGKMSDGKVYRN